MLLISSGQRPGAAKPPLYTRQSPTTEDYSTQMSIVLWLETPDRKQLCLNLKFMVTFMQIFLEFPHF